MPVQLPVKESQPREANLAPSAGTQGPSLIDSIPLPLVLLLASPYLAGKTREDAIKKAHQVYKESRFSSTIDILGEDCAKAEDCDNFVQAYKQVIDAIVARPLPCRRPEEQMTVSFKPSMFSTIVPTDTSSERETRLAEAYYRIKAIVAYAAEKNVRVTLEAEDHRWADFQLDAYFSLINEGFRNLGTVLQTRLFRTKEDLKRFDDRCRVRMVIGIYNEPAEIALTDKAPMKDLVIDYSAALAERGTYVEIATHDTDCVRNFFNRVVVPQKLPVTQFETQMLLGVPRKEVQQALVSGQYFKEMAQNAASDKLEYLAELTRSGVIVRMYLPFGKDAVAGPYCKRRLRANPNMISYGIKNVLHIQ